ncbi:hypothetical protein [Streptomyces sp. LS1784]|uniref:hypothetical protein n=1 Tax=Streptomyces sp. LS1784 TaxID=2851533 RepID=UPI001CCFC1F8|nr:hypothetical protein [Streptomyces sp. LS1784]
MPVIFHQRVVRIRPGTRTDRAGNSLPNWSPAAVTRLPVGRLSVQPSTQAETAEADRTRVVTGWHVLSAPGTAPDVRSGDRIEYDGLLCEVVGEVARWPDPVTGRTHHVEWTMTRSTG